MSFLYDVRSGKVVKSKLYSNNLHIKDVLNFNPLSLFAGGKQGVWYDPSDKSTLFQDVAGTVPVTKDGDPVGLMLDKSQGLGVNLWSDINVSIVNNNNNSTDTMGAYKDLRMINTASSGLGYPRFSFNIGLEVGKRYYVKGVLKGTLSKLASIRLSTSGSTSVVSFNTLTGVFIGCVIAESTIFQVATNLSIGEYLEISSIEIREAKGNHATQSVSTARPLYKTDGILHWIDTDAIDDSLVIPLALGSKTFTLGLGYIPVDGDAFVLVNSIINSNYALVATKESTSTSLSVSATINFIKTNGMVRAPVNSGELHTLLMNSNLMTSSITYVGDWGDRYGYSSYSSKSLRGFKRTTAYIMVENLTDTTELDKYLAKKSGLTIAESEEI